MKTVAVATGSFLLGATVGVLGIATIAGRWVKGRGKRS